MPHLYVMHLHAFLAGPEKVLAQMVSNVSILIRQGVSGAGVVFR